MTGVPVVEFLARVSRMRRRCPLYHAYVELTMRPYIRCRRDRYVREVGGWRAMADAHFPDLLNILRTSPGTGILAQEDVELYLRLLVGLQSTTAYRLKVSWN